MSNRQLPQLAQPGDEAPPTTLSEVIDTVETATNSTDPLVHYTALILVATWCEVQEFRIAIEGILGRRLALPPPACHKAIILAQFLPPASLCTLLPLLRPHGLSAPYHLIELVQHLITLGEGHEAELKKQEAETKLRWEAWCQLFGKSAVSWHDAPVEPEWTWWGIKQVSPDEWWKLH